MNIGDIITWGPYSWRVLDARNDAALLITEDIVEQRAYHDAYTDTTWAECELRRYLHGAFLDRFTEEERAQILTVTNQNPDNPWYGTRGGEDTRDRVFIPSLEEAVCRYFGDSGANLRDRSPKQRYWFQKKDANNDKRRATFRGGMWWWWLRSPGRLPVKAVYIHGEGEIGIQGNNIHLSNIGTFHLQGDNHGGVRPCLWVKNIK